MLPRRKSRKLLPRMNSTMELRVMRINAGAAKKTTAGTPGRQKAKVKPGNEQVPKRDETGKPSSVFESSAEDRTPEEGKDRTRRRRAA